jgi:glutaredoxin-related protein
METSELNLEGQIPETEIQNRKIWIPLDGSKSFPKCSLSRRGRVGYTGVMESISVGFYNHTESGFTQNKQHLKTDFFPFLF